MSIRQTPVSLPLSVADLRYLKLDQQHANPEDAQTILGNALLDDSNGFNKYQIANKNYVNVCMSSVGLNEFFSDTASDLGSGQLTMSSSHAEAATITTPALTVGYNNDLFVFVTGLGEPSLTKLLPGIFEVHIHARHTGDPAQIQIGVYGWLYKRMEAAPYTETEIGPSPLTFITDSDGEYHMQFWVTDEVTLAPTDRLLLKMGAVYSGTAGLNPTIVLGVGGDTDSGLAVRTFLSSVLVPYTGASKDLDMGDFGIKSASNVEGAQLVSSITTGTAPMSITSTTVVPNLNASLLEGHASNYFVASGGALGTPSSGTLTNCTFPTLNQNTTGTAAGLTAQYIDWNQATGGNSIANKPTLGTIASQAANNVSISGGSITGITDLAVADGGTGLSTFAAGSAVVANSANTISAVTSTTGTKVLTNTTGTITWETPSSTTVSYSKSFVLTNPTSTASGPVWRCPVGITITAIHVLCMDGTNIVGQMWEYDANGLNGATVDSSDITATAGTNANDDGTLSNPGIAADNYLGWKTTSVSGAVTKVIVTWEYTLA